MLIAYCISAQTAFQQRIIAFKNWQSAENTLLRKREAKAKIERWLRGLCLFFCFYHPGPDRTYRTPPS